jgi:hypothetical protein
VSAIYYILYDYSIYYFPWLTFSPFTLVLPQICVQFPVWLFSVVPLCHAFPVCCSSIFWMIFRWFHSFLIFIVSHLFLRSTGRNMFKVFRFFLHQISIYHHHCCYHHSIMLNLQRFSWLTKSTDHYPSGFYSRLVNYTAYVKYWCFLHYSM